MVFIQGINYPERMLVRDMLTRLYGISQKSATWFHRAPACYEQHKLPETQSPQRPLAATFTSSRTTSDDENQQSESQSSTTSSTSTSSTSSTDKYPVPSPRRHNLLSRILAKHHIHNQQRLGTLSQPQVQSLSQTLADLTLENDLRRKVQDDIKKLAHIGSYRGKRHAMRLPARGQRTRTQTMSAFKLNKIDRAG